MIVLADRHERVGAHGKVLVSLRVQMQRQLGMMIGEHQLAVAVDEHQDRIVDVGRNDAGAHFVEIRSERAQPRRQEVERDGMAGGDLPPLPPIRCSVRMMARVSKSISMMSSAASRKNRPAGVNVGGKLLRLMSSAPTHCSSD